MDYQQRLQWVIDYIGEYLDDELSLEKLSNVACLSKFHFHRLFTALTGLSLQQMIRWLRLKRAAHQLLIYKDRSILTIAIDAGFQSHEAFSRVFKQTCGLSPKQFRQNHDWSFWEKPPYRLPQQEEITMQVTIKQMPATRLAVIEHRGDPNLIANSVNKLITWAKSQATLSKPQAGDAFGFGYDDPKTTPADEFRFDLGRKIPENLTLTGEVIEKYLPAGRYAVTMHKGSRENLGDTVYPLYREWLPNSGEELGDLPCVFCYHNFEHDVAETELLTEIWLLLK